MIRIVTHNGRLPSQGGVVEGVLHEDGHFARTDIPFAAMQANHIAYAERQQWQQPDIRQRSVAPPTPTAPLEESYRQRPVGRRSILGGIF